MSAGTRPEAAEPRVEVRSFHAVFDLERRIYRVDRLRLNPAGVPVRGVLYFAGLSIVVAVAARLPVVGWALGRLPWFIRYLAAPGALAALLAMLRVDGRPFHRSMGPMLRLVTGPRTMSRLSPCQPFGTIWRPRGLVLIPDGSDPHIRDFRYRGPGAALVLREHERIAFARVGSATAADVPAIRGVVNARPLAVGRVVGVPRGGTLVVRRVRPASGGTASRRPRR
jgi:hypothetical protein